MSVSLVKASPYTDDVLHKAPEYIRAFDRMWKFINENPTVMPGDYVVQVDDKGSVVKDSYGAPHKYEVNSITPSGLILACKVFASGKRGAPTAVNARFKISMDPGQMDKIMLGDNVTYDPDEDIKLVAARKRKVTEYNKKHSIKFKDKGVAEAWLDARVPGESVWIGSYTLLDFANHGYEVEKIATKTTWQYGNTSAWSGGKQVEVKAVYVKAVGGSGYSRSYSVEELMHQRVSTSPPLKVEQV